MQVVIHANAPAALTELCGVSLLERLLRILQRLGVGEATILSETPEAIRAATEPPSWARRDLKTEVTQDLKGDERCLLLPGDIYCDARLVRALLESPAAAALVDSNPPPDARPLLQGCPRNDGGFVSGAAIIERCASDNIAERVQQRTIATIDAAAVPPYVMSMRRDLRPLFFPAPPLHLRRLAERLILDTGQPGTLDIPAIIQSPIETFIMRGLCRTRVTPNQITLCGVVVAFVATALFAGGHLWLGMIPALAIGVIDGLDGKQARIKIETTEAGKSEHVVDYVYEMSWWAALAFWFWRSGQLPQAGFFFALIVLADLTDRLAKREAKLRTGRLLDDLTPFDRFVRLIGARRDVYLWALAIALPLGAAAKTFALCGWWGAATAAVHVVRAAMIARRRRRRPPLPVRH